MYRNQIINQNNYEVTNMKTFRDIVIHLIAIPILVGTVSYLSMDEKKKDEVKRCLNKKLKQEEKMIKECLNN